MSHLILNHIKMKKGTKIVLDISASFTKFILAI